MKLNFTVNFGIRQSIRAFSYLQACLLPFCESSSPTFIIFYKTSLETKACKED